MRLMMLMALFFGTAQAGIDHGNHQITTGDMSLTHPFTEMSNPEINQDVITVKLTTGTLEIHFQKDSNALDPEIWHHQMTPKFNMIRRNGNKGYVLNSDVQTRTEVFRIGIGKLMIIRGQGTDLIQKFDDINLEVFAHDKVH
jgi:hypothetical protein